MDSTPTRLSRAMGAVIDFLLAFAVLCLVSLPWSLKWLIGFVHLSPALYVPMLVILFVSGLCAAGILWQAHRIFQTVNQGDPFIRRNVRSLKITGWLCFGIALVYAVGLLSIRSPFMALVLVAFAFLGTFLFIVADLLFKAVQIKEENELTI